MRLSKRLLIPLAAVVIAGSTACSKSDPSPEKPVDTTALMRASQPQPEAAPPPPDAEATDAAGQTTLQNVGDCEDTQIAEVGSRLEDAPDSGSEIGYTDSIHQVWYDVIPAVSNSQTGDPVRLCLTSVPQNCPPGDDRGKVYQAQNGRTGESWTGADSEHECGGA